tara:strand:+ start:45 stop:239 length:195 start_codon:yes stop_codon:yes gene_type:complete
MSKDLILEIKENLKIVKSNRPDLTEDQLVASVCVMHDISSSSPVIIDFAIVESIYNETKEVNHE